MEKVLIEARSLSKIIGAKKIVDQIDLEIQKGECFGILGSNGAGKSTILKMLYGATRPTSGDLYIKGLNALKVSQKVKPLIGVSPQEIGLDPEFSVYDNLFVFCRYLGLTGRVARKRTEEVIRQLRLDEYRVEIAINQSRGVQKRIAIARALLHNPEILILDEPTEGIESNQRQIIWSVLNELKSDGKTIFLATQFIKEIEILCDRILILDKGKSLCLGEPKHLIESVIGKEVVEFLVGLDDIEYYIKKVRSSFEYQILDNRVRLFVPPNLEGKKALDLFDSDQISIRKASLEDVFLKLSGHTIRQEEI